VAADAGASVSVWVGVGGGGGGGGAAPPPPGWVELSTLKSHGSPSAASYNPNLFVYAA